MISFAIVLLSGSASAQEKTIMQQLVGAWTLSSIYDQGQDGKKNDTWGPGVKGALMFSPSGRFSFQLISADRVKTGAKNPRSPIGPAIGYFGTYTVDEKAKTFTYHIERCTFPQWDGIDRTASIESLSEDQLKFMSAVVHDPNLGDIVPYQEWKRAM